MVDRGNANNGNDNMDEFDRMIVDVTDGPEPAPGGSTAVAGTSNNVRKDVVARNFDRSGFDFSSDSDPEPIDQRSDANDADYEPDFPKKTRGRPSRPKTEAGGQTKPKTLQPRRKSLSRKKSK